MKILVATHKEKIFKENKVIQGIQVGSANAGYRIDENYFQDNTGDNISEKNPYYNELTALYWMWKNLKDENILGLVHYRRYFDFFYNRFLPKKIQKKVSQEDAVIKKHIENPAKIESLANKWLDKHDVILPVKFVYKKFNSLKEDYYHHHRQEDWDVTMQVILEQHPEYASSIDKYLNNDNKIYWANLFVARYEFVDHYCQWLFSILSEVENRITVSENHYQRRVYGFLSERLFTLYLLHNNFKVKEIPTLLITEMFDKYEVLKCGGSSLKD